jgi:hypothetical protein
MFDKEVSKITHLGDAPPPLRFVRCLSRPGSRHITPLLAGARSSSSMAKQPRPSFLLPLFTEMLGRGVLRSTRVGDRRHSVSRPDRLGGAEHSARVVLGSHDDVRLRSVNGDSGLEALLGDGFERLKPVRGWAGKRPPGGDLRGTVPAGVERHLVAITLLGHHGGSSLGWPPHGKRNAR